MSRLKRFKEWLREGGYDTPSGVWINNGEWLVWVTFSLVLTYLFAIHIRF